MGKDILMSWQIEIGFVEDAYCQFCFERQTRRIIAPICTGPGSMYSMAQRIRKQMNSVQIMFR